MPYALKRKRNQLQDSDDEELSFGKQILPVANLPDDFDREPMNGMEYLFTVRRDARQLPHVTRVANPYEIPEAPIILPPSSSLRPTHPALPSETWRTSFTKRFKNFRKNVIQPTIHIHLPQDPNHRLIPDKVKRDCWWAFLAGRPESEWNPPKVPRLDASNKRRYKYRREGSPRAADDDNQDIPPETWHINDEGDVELALTKDLTGSLPTPSGSPTPSEHSIKESRDSTDIRPSPDHSSVTQNFKQREPTPTLAAYLDNRTSLHLLMYFVHWINVQLTQPDTSAYRMTETHARWIFVLLSRVEDHISADDTSLLRNLARASLALLKDLIGKRAIHTEPPSTSTATQEENIEGDEICMSERSCWIIVTAVTGIWGQRDLWMDAEDMLAKLSV